MLHSGLISLRARISLGESSVNLLKPRQISSLSKYSISSIHTPVQVNSILPRNTQKRRFIASQ